MEKINFTLIPPLDHFALFKIAITLWKKQSARFHSKELYSLDLSSFWKLVETGSEKRVNELPLPVRLKMNVLNVYRILCMEIRLWIKFHSKFISKEFNWLCIYADWTPIGEIDYKRTALKLVRSEKLPLIDRYELACIYCFNEFIRILFSKLGNERRCRIKGERESSVYEDFVFRQLIYVWSFTMKKNTYLSDDKLFSYTARSGNRAASQYFFHNLSIGARYKCLVKVTNGVLNRRKRSSASFPLEEYSKILFFLFQQMNVEQVDKVMQSNACAVLKCFLDWPLQYHFMTMCRYAWKYLDESSYNSILSAIAIKSSLSYQDWDYEELRREFLQQSPDACKHYLKGISRFLNK